MSLTKDSTELEKPHNGLNKKDRLIANKYFSILIREDDSLHIRCCNSVGGFYSRHYIYPIISIVVLAFSFYIFLC